MLYRLHEVLEDIEKALTDGSPFALVRNGDNELSQLWGYCQKRDQGKAYSERLQRRFKHQGYCPCTADDVIEKLIMASNYADYVSGFQTINDERAFWRNTKHDTGSSEDVKSEILNWRGIYRSAGIFNEHFCCQDINFKLFLRGWRNLKILLQESAAPILLISPYASKIAPKLKKNGLRIALALDIPNRNGTLYNWQDNIFKTLGSQRDKYLVALVGAGVQGGIFAAKAKENGKIGIDIGKVLEAWMPPGELHPLFRYWMSHKYSRWVYPKASTCEFVLTEEGLNTYAKYF